jgi:acetyl esterase/lipase
MKLQAIISLGLLLALAGTAAAQTTQTTRAELPAPDNFLGIATFPLWEADAPGALGKALADIPTLTIFRPHRGTANGTAVIVAPGGAYLGLAANLEGLNAMKPDQKGVPSYCSALKIEPEKCKGFEQYSPDSRVSAQTPPAFIYHTTDDELVPVEASVTFYRALRTAGVSAEMHLFAKGKHGSGLGLGDAALDLWPMLLEAWLRGRGLLTPDPAVAPVQPR